MTKQPDTWPPPPGTDEDVAWVGSNPSEVRRRLAGDEILYSWVGITLGFGLIANVAGFLWASVASGTIDGLLADLLQSLGTALWTGAVLILFIQIIPTVQRRAALRALRKYEEQSKSRGPADGGRGG